MFTPLGYAKPTTTIDLPKELPLLRSYAPFAVLTAKFFASLDVRTKDECWEWKGPTRSNMGYGYFKIGTKKIAAHRFSFEFFHRETIGDRLVRHRCDNPPCCNPFHLELGTAADNVRDRDSRGRGRWAIGENQRSALLTEEKVRRIRMLYSRGYSGRCIAKAYGVAFNTVSKIKLGLTWSHVS